MEHHISGTWSTREVIFDGNRLSPQKSQAAFNHSPDGFNWGYGGSGPAQLALALLLEVTDKHTAIRYHQNFKFYFVAKLPQSDFDVNFDIENWLEGKMKEDEI